MPRKRIQMVQLPSEQPDCCAECPLLGLIPDTVKRPKYSKETHVCIATGEALSRRGTHVRRSQKDSHHPWKRDCDMRWHMWLTLPRRQLGVNIEDYKKYRLPYEATKQLIIKFSSRRNETDITGIHQETEEDDNLKDWQQG